MIDEQSVVTGAKARPQPRWTTPLAIAGVLAILLAGAWLLTPHLVSDQVPEVVGVIPQGGVITLPSGTDADASDDAGSFQTSVRVTNTGLLPVTLSTPSFGELSGTGTAHSVGLALSRSGSEPYQAEITLGRGEQAVVVVMFSGSECSETGGSESLTTLKDLILRAQVGPIAREVRVSAWVTYQVVTEDGSALPNCQ
jgi:hypothetical protein